MDAAWRRAATRAAVVAVGVMEVGSGVAGLALAPAAADGDAGLAAVYIVLVGVPLGILLFALIAAWLDRSDALLSGAIAAAGTAVVGTVGAEQCFARGLGAVFVVGLIVVSLVIAAAAHPYSSGRG